MPSQHSITLRLREPTRGENCLIPCFLSQKATVLDAEKGGFIGKKRRFLKMIRIFVGIKIIYPADYQRLSCNAENKRFSVRRTTSWQISAVCVVRIGILLNLFSDILVNAERDKSRPYAGSCRLFL